MSSSKRSWQGCVLEAHEHTITELRARLRDHSAHQSPASARGGAGAACVGGEQLGRGEMNSVVQKMERIVANLRSENAVLHKKAASTLKCDELGAPP